MTLTGILAIFMTAYGVGFVVGYKVQTVARFFSSST